METHFSSRSAEISIRTLTPDILITIWQIKLKLNQSLTQTKWFNNELKYKYIFFSLFNNNLLIK